MAISLKSVNASTAKYNDKPLPWDNTIGLGIDIRVYEIDYDDNTEEG